MRRNFLLLLLAACTVLMVLAQVDAVRGALPGPGGIPRGGFG